MEEMGFPFGRELTAIEAEVRAATFRSILERTAIKASRARTILNADFGPRIVQVIGRPFSSGND
jgi:hypothetical protein